MAISGFGEIAEHLRRSPVLIDAGSHGNGSGVIWTSDGIIVTDAHVARSSALCVQLWDGRELPGEIMSRDPRGDLALLHIYGEDLPAARPADSSRARPGELAIAIGNPMGFVGALTFHCVWRTVPSPHLKISRWPSRRAAHASCVWNSCGVTTREFVASPCNSALRQEGA